MTYRVISNILAVDDLQIFKSRLPQQQILGLSMLYTNIGKLA